MSEKFTYQKAGVDIEKAEQSLAKVKKMIGDTHNSRVLKNIGAFGGFYEFPAGDYQQPVLVSSTDGVGTKLKVAMLMNRHNTVGRDLVNHCINDIAVCGARPLYFLDYFACGKLEENVYQQIMEGFAAACREAELPLIGGETAEMPDIYREGEYDLAGTIVGVVEKAGIIDGSSIREGDTLIGVASNGLHTNGYSLARKVLLSRYKPQDKPVEIGNSIGDELLKTHINYYPVIREICDRFPVKGMAHITGGGLQKNTARIMPEGLRPAFEWYSWPVPAIFDFIRDTGSVPEADMRQTFNLGIGLLFVVDAAEQGNLLSYAGKFNLSFHSIGKVVKA